MIGSEPAYRTISDVATLIGVPHHVLRFWETKFPVIAPLKRGGGRRYYRPDDVAAIERIARLLHVEGYTIKGVQKLLAEPPPAAVKLAAPSIAVAGATIPLGRIAMIRADLVAALAAARAL
jgi:DNA-binding transcriptional MerR regulator